VGHESFEIRAKIWKYPGPAGWHFVYASRKDSDAVRGWKGKRVGFGFVPIKATLGNTSWKTTLFPSKEGPYLLAIKASVRKKEGVAQGDSVRLRIEPL